MQIFFIFCQKIWKNLNVRRTFALANEKTQNFRSEGVRWFYGAGSEAVRRQIHYKQDENLQIFEESIYHITASQGG